MKTITRPRNENGGATEVDPAVSAAPAGSIRISDTRQSNRARRRAQWDAKACECRQQHNRYLDRLMAVVDARLAAWARGEPTPAVPAMEGSANA